MKSLFRKVGACLRQTWVWTLLCTLCIGGLVWFFGPLLAIDDYKFWASPTARLLTISLLFLAWGLGMVFSSEQSGRIKKSCQPDADPSHTLGQARVDDEQREIRSRFKRALGTSSSVNSGGGKRSLKDLPWYLLIGPTASGKTSLLERSGLEFAFDGAERKPPLGLTSTGDCDWYCADQAVLMDTAGRYLTQTDKAVDGSAWGGLLDLLRRGRRGRPLNGVLVVVPAEVLLRGCEEDVIDLAGQIRSRVQEIQRKLRANVPIYLVLSKADNIPGFNEFFDSLTREEADQVLGASFSGAPRGCDLAVLRGEFEALLQRLNSQLLLRLHQERDSECRGFILDFPQQLAQLGPHLCLLVELAFRGEAWPLRGFYLTSAAASSRLAGGQTSQPHERGNGRFIHHLFARVIFPEADLAGPDQRERRRTDWRRHAIYLGVLTTVGLFGWLWVQGYRANHERLEHLRTLAQRWDENRSVLVANDDPVRMLESLDIRFKATEVFPLAKAVPLYERIGLYQGEVASPAVLGAYEHELKTQLLPQVAQMLEEHIQGRLSERENLLNSLRAYLMLAQPERRDRPWLMDWIARDWSLRYPGNEAVQNGLRDHFERLLEQPFVLEINQPLVAQAREALRSESLATVVYRMLREQANHLPKYSLDQHLGPQGTLLVGTDHVIPGFYTRQGYGQYFSTQGTKLIDGLLRDNWVLGEGASLNGKDLRQLLIELEQLYFRDYADRWSEAIGRVSLQTTHNADEMVGQLAGLTSAHSPVLQLLVQVREHTRIQGLVEPMDKSVRTPGNSDNTVTQLVSATVQAADSLATSLPDTGQKSLRRRFEPLHRLLEPDNSPSVDLTLALQALEDTLAQLAPLARASDPEQAAFELAKRRMGGQRDALGNLRSASTRLPRPFEGWFNGLADDSWRIVLSGSYRYLNQRYQGELYGFYRKAISKRYPFSAHSASDVAINDFREFFKDQGTVDRFFDSYMRPFVSGTPGNYRLRSLDGQSLPMSRTYLDQMTAAHTIRQGFFVDNPAEPHIQFKLEPYTLDPAVSRAEFRFGDKTLEYRHGPIQPLVFTWPTDAQGGRTSLVLDRMAGGRGVGIEKNTGPWSLFRLFDLMQAEYLTGRDMRVLKADLGGLRANFLLTSQRTPNPFDMTVLRTFRMPAQL
ncbi:type VI secretion system membrane subunit TssM [Pseudomonas sp. SAICEU22]|uniref:Type VI secretion system membrane subunit TssM n=1 Tax=Pseudomonas agronomica TaxID=2979328 RepID=A0ABT3F891_9PSED|nr:type VI secretion system membrane subunit TssM [Pseudomonas agronomica]MCW1244730.1 type VI secretion system membrane subunit TssM [Pseudomonas agronomica]